MADQAGDRMQTVGNYTLLETVGQGTFGEVMLAMERHTRESVAVKVLEKDKITDDDAKQRLMNEIAILHRVQHPNLLHLLEAIEEIDCIYLVTEYVGGGELFAYIVNKGRLDEAEASRLFAQMVAAVDTCHRQLVIHRDLKVRRRRSRLCLPSFAPAPRPPHVRAQPARLHARAPAAGERAARRARQHQGDRLRAGHDALCARRGAARGVRIAPLRGARDAAGRRVPRAADRHVEPGRLPVRDALRLPALRRARDGGVV